VGVLSQSYIDLYWYWFHVTGGLGEVYLNIAANLTSNLFNFVPLVRAWILTPVVLATRSLKYIFQAIGRIITR
jgi:hypothetical protein